jgi:hypothetical protein
MALVSIEEMIATKSFGANRKRRDGGIHPCYEIACKTS